MRFVLKKGTETLDDTIKWFTWGKYSHMSLLTDDNLVVEAVWPRVRKLPFSVAYPRLSLCDVFHVDTTPEQDKQIISFALAQVGKPYDLIGDLHFLTRPNYVNEPDDKWFCSELGFRAFLEGKIELLARVEAYKVYPTLISYSPLARML